jgi:hypothetical protein
MRKMILSFCAALAAFSATPALACLITPPKKWAQIKAALPKAKLSDAALSRVDELHAQTFALLAEAGLGGGRKKFDAAKYREAEKATDEAIRVVGLKWVSHGPPMRGCNGSYQLKDDISMPADAPHERSYNSSD